MDVENYSAWIVTILLFLTGLLGCVLPVLPGHLLILAGAISYRIMMGAEASLEWWGFGVLLFLIVLSQVFDFLSGSLGAKMFGGSKWSAMGALLGGIAGLLFLPLGLLLGPLIGAFLFEKLFAQKEMKPSLAAGIGGLVGTLTGMVFKLFIGVLMITWFFLDVFKF